MYCLLLASTPLSAQVIWSENFDSYANGTTIGANNNTANPSADWTAVCPFSVAATDYFQVENGLLEGRDTNGPATWESESIDISGCSTGVEVTMDLSEIGTMEACRPTSSCLATDWISISTSIDGGAFTRYTSASGGNCVASDGCADGDYVTLGDFAPFTFSTGCLFGNTLQIRIEVQNWAASEVFRIDNIAVTCNATNCSVLPLELEQFEVERQAAAVQLRWQLATDPALASISIERSADGIRFERLQALVAGATQAQDRHPLEGDNYYRLRLVELSGAVKYSPIRTIHWEAAVWIRLFPNPAQDQVTIQLKDLPTEPWSVTLHDWSGQQVAAYTDIPIPSLSIPSQTLPAGAYIVSIHLGTQAWRRRLVIQ